VHWPELCVRYNIHELDLWMMLIVSRDHIAELNNARPKQPFFFLKPPSSILIPKAGPILRPRGVTLHYEVELGVLMKKNVRDLDENDEKAVEDAIDGLLLLPVKCFHS